MDNRNLTEEKNDILGEFDYLNSLIGLAKSFIDDKKIKEILTDIQNDIFVLQAAVVDQKNVAYALQSITLDRVFSIQKETYLIERHMNQLHHFIIPEGVPAACITHCVRTVARNIERKIPGYLHAPTLTAMYLDRVACFMFALARKINKEHGVEERVVSYRPHTKGHRNTR